MSALNTDLYELTMAAGYVAAGKQGERATFELSVRRFPDHREYLIAAGLEQAVEYLLKLRFEPHEIDYLRALPQFRHAPAAFFDYLRDLQFTGDLFAMPEGTPFLPNEPLVTVRAPLIEAQIIETYLLSTISFQTSIATKAARCVAAAEGRPVTEFGSRRAHSPAAALLAARAAFVGGCTGTSNAEAGMRFDIPVSGTSAHSWTMAFPSERDAFERLQALLGEHTVFLVDTYDTLRGTDEAIRRGRPAWGVRLDSGNLDELSREVRRKLDAAGLTDSHIMATNDLDEYRIGELVAAGAPIDSFGVGTQLATSADAPALPAVYKLVEIDGRPTAKYSGEKVTLPGAKQVLRKDRVDTLAIAGECLDGYPLLRPVIAGGALLEPLPPLRDIQNYASECMRNLPREMRVSEQLQQLVAEHRNMLAGGQ